MEPNLRERAGNACELCGSAQAPAMLGISPQADGSADRAILACTACTDQISGTKDIDPTHWHCLNETAWSQVPAVQVAAFRVLSRLPEESWARDLRDMLYLDENTLAWAEAGLTGAALDADIGVVHKDTHGAVLSSGDTVTLIRDLKVKGAGFTAKRGTAVRNIGLVADTPAHIEGRVNDQRIVILTEFVKKS